MWYIHLISLLSILFVHAATWRDIFSMQPLAYIFLVTLLFILVRHKHYVLSYGLSLLSLLYPWSDNYWSFLIILLLSTFLINKRWVSQLILICWLGLTMQFIGFMLYGYTLWLPVISYILFLSSYCLLRGIPNIFSDSLDNKETLAVKLGSMKSMQYSFYTGLISTVFISLLGNPYTIISWTYPLILFYTFYHKNFQLLRYTWHYILFIGFYTICVSLASKAW